VLFASSFNLNKVVTCSTNTGDLMVADVPALTRLHAADPINQESQPPAPVPVFAPLAALQAQELGYPVLSPSDLLYPDATLQWFEFYAEALSSNRFSMEIIHADLPESEGICLFPRHPPLGASALTRGIKVTASPLFIPELSNLKNVDDGDMQYFFAYSIRYQLLGEEEQKQVAAAAAAARVNGGGGGPASIEDPFQSVQLLDRTWIIRNSTGAIESELHGEAVVGQYPLLLQGGENFTYQSCTHQREPQGSMEGEFTFIEGSIENPGPRQVKAQCPTFQLIMPDVVF
jgi:F-box protein 3